MRTKQPNSRTRRFVRPLAAAALAAAALAAVAPAANAGKVADVGLKNLTDLDLQRTVRDAGEPGRWSPDDGNAFIPKLSPRWWNVGAFNDGITYFWQSSSYTVEYQGTMPGGGTARVVLKDESGFLSDDPSCSVLDTSDKQIARYHCTVDYDAGSATKYMVYGR